MRWAARHAGVKYRDFCLTPASKCHAMIRSAEDFGMDWVTVLSDPYAEASAFGRQIEYPENNLPLDHGAVETLEALLDLTPYDVAAHPRTANRVEEIRLFRELSGDQYFVVGWVEGPVAEYADLRGLTDASLDFMDEPAQVGVVMDMIVEAAKRFITMQVKPEQTASGLVTRSVPRLVRRFIMTWRVGGRRLWWPMCTVWAPRRNCISVATPPPSCLA